MNARTAAQLPPPMTLQVIYEAEGVYMPGLAGGRTAGKRHTATTEGKKARGGKGTRMEFHQALRYNNIQNFRQHWLNVKDVLHISLHRIG